MFSMIKRMILFFAVNMAILIVLTVAWHAIGMDQILANAGFPPTIITYLPIALAFGMGGSFFQLAISKWMAKRAVKAQVIENPKNNVEQWLVQTVAMQADQVGIKMPEVAIFDSPEPNAFATGATKNSSLVAVSTGLLANMTQDEAEAVLAHEVSHIANGDMVTMTLIQGVLNTFVILIARVIGTAIDSFMRGNDNEGGHGVGFWVGMIVSEIILGFLAHLIVMRFSRWREFRADEGGAMLASRHKMIAALKRLESREAAGRPVYMPESLAAFGIRGEPKGMMKLLMSHPPLSERIKALEGHKDGGYQSAVQRG